jgi:hypothetical protein
MISTFCPSDGGLSKHHRFMPSGIAAWVIFVVGLAGA